MNKIDPLISIIIPTYNRAGIIMDTLNSVRSQVFTSWECIVIDDSSNDDTRKIILELSSEDSRFIYFSNKRKKGAPGARNTGLAICRGEFVMFLDSDDLLLPHCLKERLAYFKQNSGLDLLIAQQKRLVNDEVGNYINIPTSVHPLIRFFSLFPNEDIPWINNVLIRKSFLFDNQINWNEALERYQDIDFNVHILLSNPDFKWSEDTFDSYWSYSDGRVTIGTDKKNEYGKLISILEVYWNVLNKYNDSKNLKCLLKQQYHSLICWLAFHNQSNTHANQKEYLRFIRSRSMFNSTELLMLQLRRFVNSFGKSNYFQRNISKKIERYFELKYPPVVETGYFLKVNEWSKEQSSTLI
jgi:glycosyltransferase involved in cell wall biosynthesis